MTILCNVRTIVAIRGERGNYNATDIFSGRKVQRAGWTIKNPCYDLNMTTVAFDTLAFSQKLEDVGVEPKVAKATAMAVADAQQALIEGQLDGLVKASDLQASLQGLESRLEVHLHTMEVRLTNRIVNYSLAMIAVYSGIVGGLLALFEWVI